MRKILLLLAMLLLLASPAQALTLPYPEETVLSVVELTPAQRALADSLYTPIFNHREKIDLPKGTRYDDVAPAMNALMQDYPELFHLGRDYTITYYQDEPEYATALRPQYRMTAGEAASARAVLYAQAYLLADAYPDAPSLHDALLNMTSYGGDTEMRHTAVGALLEGQATCEGYAQAMSLLCRMAGIPCGVVVGEAVDSAGVTERHSWNIASVDGFTFIDPTWNDQDSLGLNTRWYFGLSTTQMAADHTPDTGQRIPLCGEQTNWHALHGQVISTQTEADAALRRLASGETVNLRVTDEELYHQLAHDTYDFIDSYNGRNPDAAFYGAYSVVFSDAQRCVILQRAE